MGEEFYAIIKLVSGEEIFSLISIDENNGDPVIVLQNPVTMKMMYNSKGSYLKIKSWIEMSNDDFFIIKPDKIITMTETKEEKIINIYNNYISDEEIEDNIDVYNLKKDSTGKVEISSKMGYVSSVEDARRKLENLFKGLKEG